MNTHKIRIVETRTMEVEVPAATEIDAHDQVACRYYAGEIRLTAENSTSDTSFEIVIPDA